ncbi:udh, partial [Symbiodinium microadriaticum]
RRRVAITGAAGFLGQLARQSCEVRSISALFMVRRSEKASQLWSAIEVREALGVPLWRGVACPYREGVPAMQLFWNHGASMQLLGSAADGASPLLRVLTWTPSRGIVARSQLMSNVRRVFNDADKQKVADALDFLDSSKSWHGAYSGPVLCPWAAQRLTRNRPTATLQFLGPGPAQASVSIRSVFHRVGPVCTTKGA